MVECTAIILSGSGCYLLKGRNGFILIDCGSRNDMDRLMKKLKQNGIKPEDIHYLFLTHHHSDHCGLLNLLTVINPRIKIIMSGKCSEYLQSGKHFSHMDERYASQALRIIAGTYLKLAKNNSTGFTPYIPQEADIIINEDSESILPKLGIQGSILMTPGHTEDSISLVTGGSAFVGDAARNLLNFTGAPYEPILLYDREACRKSWRKLLSTGAETIYPGHGRPFEAKRLPLEK